MKLNVLKRAFGDINCLMFRTNMNKKQRIVKSKKKQKEKKIISELNSNLQDTRHNGFNEDLVRRPQEKQGNSQENDKEMKKNQREGGRNGRQAKEK